MVQKQLGKLISELKEQMINFKCVKLEGAFLLKLNIYF